VLVVDKSIDVLASAMEMCSNEVVGVLRWDATCPIDTRAGVSRGASNG
jgi:hypothetical protein